MGSIFFGFAAPDRTSLALTQREKEREREKSKQHRVRKSAWHCCCIFQLIALPAARQDHSGISREKPSPNNVICLFCSQHVCKCVYKCVWECMFVRCHMDTSQLSSISCHNPSKQATIHPWSHASIYLSMQLPVRASHVVGLNYNVSCHARIFARSLCRCKEFNMCFD